MQKNSINLRSFPRVNTSLVYHGVQLDANYYFCSCNNRYISVEKVIRLMEGKRQEKLLRTMSGAYKEAGWPAEDPAKWTDPARTPRSSPTLSRRPGIIRPRAMYLDQWTWQNSLGIPIYTKPELLHASLDLIPSRSSANIYTNAVMRFGKGRFLFCQMYNSSQESAGPFTHYWKILNFLGNNLK